MKSRIYTTIIIAVLIVCGCQKNTDILEELPVSFIASVQEMARGDAELTKGTMWNETGTTQPLSKFTTKFSVSAWNNSNGASVIPTGTVVNYSESESKWIPAGKYLWVENIQKTVFAYANLPESGSSVVCNSKDYLSLSYNVPDEAANQTDILLGVYVGKSDKGCAELHFRHPLTSVKFNAGTIAGGVTVNKLSIVDIAGSGAISLYPNGEFSNWKIDDYDQSVHQLKESGLGTSPVGEPFLLIPQDLESHPVKVVLELSDGCVVTSTLSTGKWEAGVAYSYTINYDNPE